METQKVRHCRLCGKSETVKSHIMPKFIIRWLNKTGTGRMRHLKNPNMPAQDGVVEKLLCRECESRFSRAETYFANKIFLPVVELNESVIEYNHNFRFFVISVFWRLLVYYFIEDLKDTSWSKKLLEIEKEWSDFLLEDTSITTKSFAEIHLLVGVDVLKNVDNPNDYQFEEDFIRYMARMVDGGAPFNDDTLLFFLKLPRFLFIMPIANVDTEGFLNSEIFEKGIFNAEETVINSSLISSYLKERMMLVTQTKENISQTQKNNSMQRYLSNKETIESKDLGKINNYISRRKNN